MQTPMHSQCRPPCITNADPNAFIHSQCFQFYIHNVAMYTFIHSQCFFSYIQKSPSNSIARHPCIPNARMRCIAAFPMKPMQTPLALHQIYNPKTLIILTLYPPSFNPKNLPKTHPKPQQLMTCIVCSYFGLSKLATLSNKQTLPHLHLPYLSLLKQQWHVFFR